MSENIHSPKPILKRKWIKCKWHWRCKLRFIKNSAVLVFINKNKRWLVFAPAILTNVFLFDMTKKRDIWRTKAEVIQVENAVLTTSNIGRNVEMDDFDYAWYEKTVVNGQIRITGMNAGYELFYGLNKIESLGKTNFELVPYEAAVIYDEVDWRVLNTGIAEDVIEPWIFPDSSKIMVYSHKWRSKYYTDRMFGISIPLKRFVKIIDNHGRLEVIEMVPEEINSIQDTIIVKD